ncbi:DUF871 domain-containing protein [Fictibacillus phosphorivorans]|uniref:DUF871 domain-containing protein n=1 Tax=Fictibacillus phosphorivorans TaxID=1221500 RepID=UPI00203AC185|nr:MupG family TIM beta-alpha barrel fold protein [Fictibacillus phosphorivorans]MCM3718696.1 MupG family TIM beta-alpha barrel fold protein [Fictibacillus phosphorivorans]MCM3776319.1 MupG family TIM beta-alpha barrel fold protein [Fictibacillus phosphorivorans]
MCYGISIYLSEPDHLNKDWIQKAAENGFQYIFTSLHIPEEKGFSFVEKVKWLGKTAQHVHMEVMADVSPASLERLGLTFEELPVIKEWGISGVRMDYGFTAKQVAWLSHSLKIGLNASTMDEVQLSELLHEGLLANRSEAWHNFYPKPFTGISKESLKERNEMFHRFGIRTMGFVQGDDRLRGPLHEGLPTIEDHRNNHPLEAALELRALGTDKICIGDPNLTEDTVRGFSYLADDIVPLYVSFNDGYEHLLNSIHTNRMDPAKYVIRSVESRGLDAVYEQDSLSVETFDRGTITVDNKLYGRYAGELQICLEPLPASPKVNIAGYVKKESESLLNGIGSGQKYILLG